LEAAMWPSFRYKKKTWHARSLFAFGEPLGLQLLLLTGWGIYISVS
jgi:hypothetical protein